MKLNLGCGGNLLAGWRNHDIDVDITKPLPFPSESADFVFAEHVVEHVTSAEAWGFFNEAHRILKPRGVLRVAVPSIERVFENADREYLEWMSDAGFGAPNKHAAVANQILNHGHRAVWSVGTLRTCLLAAGFMAASDVPILTSTHPELRGIHGHGKIIGERNNLIETIAVEATK